MSAETAIICDACARILTAASTATEARHELRELGGASLGPRDYCADCMRLRSDPEGIVERDLVAALSRLSPSVSTPDVRAAALAMIAGARARRRSIAAAWGARR